MGFSKQTDKMVKARHTVVLLLVAIAAAIAQESQVKHLIMDEAHLVATGANNFALTTPKLAKLTGWKTVSINGNNVVGVSAQCQHSIKGLESLSQEERTALEAAKEQLHQVDSSKTVNYINDNNVNIVGDNNVIGNSNLINSNNYNSVNIGNIEGNNNVVGSGNIVNMNNNRVQFGTIQMGDNEGSNIVIGGSGNVVINGKSYSHNDLKLDGQQVQRFASLRYSLPDGRMLGVNARGVGLSTFSRDGKLMVKLGPDTISMGSAGLPNGVVMVLVDGGASGVASFVYGDGRVLMKPAGCLEQWEWALIGQLRVELEASEKQAAADQEPRAREREEAHRQRDLERAERHRQREQERAQRYRQRELDRAERERTKELERARRQREKELQRRQPY